MFKITDAIEHIKKRPELYLRSGKPSGLELAERLIGDVLLLTSGPVTASRNGPWWVITSPVDWLKRSCSGPLEQLFTRIVPFPEAGPNSMRSEVLLTAFARDVLTRDRSTVYVVKGPPSLAAPGPDLAPGHNWERLVAFTLDD
jgi:hypothetical protein